MQKVRWVDGHRERSTGSGFQVVEKKTASSSSLCVSGIDDRYRLDIEISLDLEFSNHLEESLSGDKSELAVTELEQIWGIFVRLFQQAALSEIVRAQHRELQARK